MIVWQKNNLFEGGFQVPGSWLTQYYPLLVLVQRNQYMLIGGMIGIKLMRAIGWVFEL